jgi:NADP-dependent 3-hydroxy acid dehydrogenase YdfG
MESAQEGANIRTTTIYPATINTELLNTITDKNTTEGMTALYEQFGITPGRIANVVAFAIDQSEDMNVNAFTICPTTQPW